MFDILDLILIELFIPLSTINYSDVAKNWNSILITALENMNKEKKVSSA